MHRADAAIRGAEVMSGTQGCCLGVVLGFGFFLFLLAAMVMV